ncbi:MAG: hypothetical protein FJ042_00775 [Candidatus Cloacimonetes bacterium]|nr:hypothetical protein [Candidatus Cloacimonadota bacterium]
MKKFFKTVFILGGTALTAYFGYKVYKKIQGTAKLAKSLPEFLNNVYGEKPAVNIRQAMGNMKVKVAFSKEIIEKNSDIETTVREYIDDFYPEIVKGAVEIEIVEKSIETDTPCCDQENSCCGSDEDK